MKLFDYVYEGGMNYIQIEEARNGDYVSEMLIHNNIAGFVGARLRSRNAENYIVYPISGLVPLTQLVEIKRLSAAEVEGLIRSFIKAMQSMEDYLLPVSRLITEADHIYQNYGKKDEFLWIYGGREKEGGSIVNLFEFLLDKVDERDDRAVNLVYSLYQACKNFQILEMRGEASGMLSMVSEKGRELLSIKENSLELLAQKRMKEEDELSFAEDYRSSRIQQFVEKREERYFPEERRMENGGEDFFRKEVQIESNPMNDPKKKKKEKEKKTKTKAISSSVKMKSMLQKAWNYLNADIGSTEEAPAVEERKGNYKLRDVKVVKVSPEEEVKATTLLTNGMVNKKIYCLKPLEGSEEAVLITSYPFFIGKSDKDVQLRIEDGTVSRYHCRIDREDAVFWLTDLGSTNGTFLNGIRMIPFDRLKMEEGDSIVISRKKYRFSFME